MATFLSTDYDRSKPATGCGMFQLFEQHDNKQCKMYT